MTNWGSRWGALVVCVVLGAAPVAACGDDSDGNATDTTTTDTQAADTQAADTTTTDTGSTDTQVADTATTAVTFAGPHAIFAQKCTPCHSGGGSGGHNMAAADIAAAYTDSQKDAAIAKCDGLKKGACTIVRIQDGDMPRGAGCTGDPSQDSANASCLTQAEQDTLEAWIDGGMLAPTE